MEFAKHSFGVGNCFNQERKTQLRALINAGENGVGVSAVSNQSKHGHQIVHFEPKEKWVTADLGVKASGWKNPYYVDTETITISNVDKYLSEIFKKII